MASKDPKPTDALTAALEAWAERWTELSTHDIPPILYHYTDAAGFLGICQSRSLWASDATFLNDSTEVAYASGVLQEVIDQLDDEFGGDVGGPHVALDWLLKLLLDRSWRPDFDVFVSCFCAYGDLLSQWRGYPAPSGGYAIGFHTSAIFDTAGMLRRVVYDEEAQLGWLYDLIEPACKLLVEHPTEDEDPIARVQRVVHDVMKDSMGVLGANFYDCSFSFKHRMFAEESEWRLVQLSPTDPKLRPDLPRPQIRASATGLIPYLSPRLADNHEGKPPIAEVIVGPGRHPELAAKAAVRLLQSVGYQGAETMVKRSEIPLRV